MGGVGATTVGTLGVSTGQISNAGASATVSGQTYILVRPNGSGNGSNCGTGMGDLVAVKLDATASNKMSVAWCADAQGQGSPIITTSDGTQDPLVWVAGAEGSNALHAWDLLTGKLVFTGGGNSDQIQNVRKFTTPIAVHGRILVAGDGKVFAFKKP
jgi:hypothetical protein